MDAELLGTSIGPATGAVSRKLDADCVEWLVDNADAYREMLRVIARARQSIWITQLAFDADCRLYDADVRDGDSASGESLLLDALLDAAARGIAVRIILNETMLLDTAASLRAALHRARAIDIRVRGIKRFPQLLHAKMLIADEREALLLGSPFANGYWDDSNHEPSDPRRPARELGGRPCHELSMRIAGQAVQSLAVIFAELWNDVSVGARDDAPLECRPRRTREQRADGSIRIARTAPPAVLQRHPDGVAEILTEIEGALASARRLVYIEHQYLSSRRVIVALAAALRREPALEVVIVLNQNPDVTAYRGWQNARLSEAGLLTHPRVGLFALWRASPSSVSVHDWTINQVFVHSKVLIVDDRWLTVGSANLDGVSLHSYGDDFTGSLGRHVFRNVRNFDVNAVIGTELDVTDESVLMLRTRLWSEHLAIPSIQLGTRPRDGWLPLWRARAANGIDVLGARPRRGVTDALAIVLPYSRYATPSAQLRDVGVRCSPERLDVRFDPGWLEVRFSPNWVRNMFV